MAEHLYGKTEEPKTVIRPRFCGLIAAFLASAAFLNQPFPAHGADKEVSAELAEQERDGCIKNLKSIYAAIESYRRDHKDVPNWFSDLVPDYLSDVNVLVCPVCRRTGQTDIPSLADPKIASSYLFEFCPLPLGNVAPASPKSTRREWKRRQMGVVGSIVPLVRCRHHKPILNLAFDGRVYDSPPSWETM